MKTWTEMASQRHADKVATIVRDLRSVADRVEREGKPRESSVYTAGTEHQVAASRVVNAVMWGLANLTLDNLLTIAADADAAPRQEAEAEARP